MLSDDINDYCFVDTETKALPHTRGTADENVTDCGAYRYRRGARVVMIQHAIGEAPAHVSAFPDFDITRKFIWREGFIPDDLWEFHQRALAGEAWYVAWNMAFDRLMLNTIDGCVIEPEMTLDAMAQGLASNLPPKLQDASKFIGRQGKQADGKGLIKLFTGADGWQALDFAPGATGGGFRFIMGDNPEGWKDVPTNATPQSHPREWELFKSYGARDIDELRAVFQATRKLPREEWEEYWESERINDRGMFVDVDFCYRADIIATENERRLGVQLDALTGGKITKPTQRERIANWLYERTEAHEARDTLVKTWKPEDEEDEDDSLIADKLSVAEERLNRYVAYFRDLDEREGLTDIEYELLQIAEARLIGASATPKKFGKIVDMNDEGYLRGQYRWNGAQQTGRFSSMAVQIHNLIRASLSDKKHPDREVDVIDLINSLEI